MNRKKTHLIILYFSFIISGDWRKIQKNAVKRRRKNAKKYCVQSGDNIYPEDGRFSIADSNVTYRSLLNAFAQANIRNPRATK